MANLKNNDMAVSPVVATLVLIVVAVIGAVAVGTILGTFSSDVSKQASAGQAGQAAQTEILVAGSTTLIPAEQNLASDYERANPGLQINVQGGGSSEGPQSVALGIADIGAVSSGSTITSAQTANANDPIYQNLYFTQVGGRGVVFIQDASKVADPTNVVSQNDLLSAYTDALGNKGVTTVADGNISFVGTTMEQREAGSGTQGTAFKWIGGLVATNGSANTALTGCPINNGNAAMLAAVQAGKASAPVVGFVDSGYAITGGVTSNTTASGISIMGVVASSQTAAYVPTHTNIKNALHDWYYANAQDTTSVNYPQGLVGGLYWITKGSSPSAFTGNRVTTVGTSAAGSTITGFISFSKSPTEAAAFNNVGMYSMYDFI
jgi:phosphate transport system substrate-binding protein